jgi:hypothetical protein
MLKHWLNTLECELKVRVCFVAGKEYKPRQFSVPKAAGTTAGGR